ncbi:hypothetical protein BHE74_00023436 [Ensete ventricosum]|nr:hypothetical protein BHE74_00023436 [Ensete ventricosum]
MKKVSGSWWNSSRQDNTHGRSLVRYLIMRRTKSTQALQQNGGGHAWELKLSFHRPRETAQRTRVLKQAIERGEEATTSLTGLSYPKAKHRSEMRWTRRRAIVSQRRIYRSRRKGRKCKPTDSRVMGLATPWYRKAGTSVESSIPCSHGRRTLVVKGAEEVENADTNSKYQDKAEGQRSENFIRPVSTGFSSR